MKLPLSSRKKNNDRLRKYKKRNKKQALEKIYEEKISKLTEEEGTKKVRFLLPVKTQDGFIKKRIIEQENEVYDVEMSTNDQENVDDEDQENSDIDERADLTDTLKEIKGKPVSTIEFLAYRNEVLKSKRFKIGVLSSGLLENPELKSQNFKMLLDLMEDRQSKVYFSVAKLATVSLLEVFKDILPSYQILQVKQDGIMLKKETLQRQSYEELLLRNYKNYLQKLEKMCNILWKKRGDIKILNGQEVSLSEIAVKCMCDLLVTHPYFNFSINIGNFLIPLLDNKHKKVREMVAECISQIFKEDKRGELSLAIVRKLNQYIKSRKHSVHVETISVLLTLRIKDVNLDKEKVEETKQKKILSHKQRILALSKRERKRNKQLQQVEKELLETKAEENKQNKQKIATEIMSIVFTIYFRILKQTPNSKVLSACLEGLAKFADCINLDFYQDLVNAIDQLMAEGNLGLREQLHCIQCVFTILSNQGLALNIDPHRFYTHLYKNLLNVHVGKTEREAEIVLKILIQVLINRRKRITQPRLIAFIKRTTTLALQLQHNGALGLLGVVRQVMQLGRSADVLLDTDSTVGNGFYQPEMEEPEYCNAHCVALWELIALQRHYHSTVKKLSKNIICGIPTSGDGSLPIEIAKLSPTELYFEFDPSGVAFKPAVPVPKKVNSKSNFKRHSFVNNEFENYLDNVYNKKIHINVLDFYKACDMK